MISKNIILALLMSVSVLSMAQKTKKENGGLLEYIQPPSDTSLQSLKTYFIAPNVSYYQGLQASEIKRHFNLPGFSQIYVKENADFVIEITVYPLTFDSPKSKTNANKTTRDGVTTTKYTYTVSGGYQYKYILNAYDKTGVPFYDYEYSGTNSISATNLATAAAAREKYYNNKSNASKSFVSTGCRSLSNRMSNVFCYLDRKDNVKIMRVKARKHNYDDFNAAVENLKDAIKMQAKSKTVTEESLVLIKLAISSWEIDLKESEPERRKARINKSVTAAAYFNIGIAYFVMEDYENAILNLEKAKEFKKNVIRFHNYWIRTSKDMQTRYLNN